MTAMILMLGFVLAGCGSDATQVPPVGSDMGDFFDMSTDDLESDQTESDSDSDSDLSQRTSPEDWNEAVLSYTDIKLTGDVIVAYREKLSARESGALASFDLNGNIIDYFELSRGEIQDFDVRDGVVGLVVEDGLILDLVFVEIDAGGKFNASSGLTIEGDCFPQGVAVGGANRSYLNCTNKIVAISTSTFQNPRVTERFDVQRSTSIAADGDTVFLAGETLRRLRFDLLGPSVVAEETRELDGLELSRDRTKLGAYLSGSYYLYDVSSQGFNEISNVLLPPDSDYEGGQVLTDNYWTTTHVNGPDRFIRVWDVSDESNVISTGDINADIDTVFLRYTIRPDDSGIVGNGQPRGLMGSYWHQIPLPPD